MADPTQDPEYQAFLEWKANQRTPAATPIATPEDFKRAKGQVTSAKEWKRSKGGLTDLELPSGHVCRVKRPGLLALLQNGTIPDVMGVMVDKHIKRAEGTLPEGEPDDDETLKRVLADEKGRTALFDSAARVLVACVVDPEVTYHRRTKALPPHETGDGTEPIWEDIPEEERDPNLLYSDEVEFEDTLFVFQFVVGGAQKLNQFRTGPR